MPVIKRLQSWGWMTILVASGTLATQAFADEFPPCAPPQASEYLLLVKGETVEARDRIQNLLPTTTSVNVCRYLDDIVVRAGGFTSLENANAWAQYLTEVEGVQAFVARPAAPGETIPSAPIAAETVEPVPAVPPVEPAPNPVEEPAPAATTVPPAAAVVGYAPKLLGEGYAVLVDYGNNPEVAQRLQQALNQPIGLVVYEQRPFLLATQSTDPQMAAQVLQTLSNSRFGAFIVDSSEVVLLSAAVTTP